MENRSINLNEMIDLLISIRSNVGGEVECVTLNEYGSVIPIFNAQYCVDDDFNNNFADDQEYVDNFKEMVNKVVIQ